MLPFNIEEKIRVTNVMKEYSMVRRGADSFPNIIGTAYLNRDHGALTQRS